MGRGRATTGQATTTTQVYSLNHHVDIVDITTNNRLPGLQPRDGDDGLLLQLLLPGLLRHGGAGPPAAGILPSIRGLGTNHIRWLVTFCIAHGYLSCQMHQCTPIINCHFLQLASGRKWVSCISLLFDPLLTARVPTFVTTFDCYTLRAES